MNNVYFSGFAWEDYIWWQENDKRTFKQINKLIKDIGRNGYEGIGHPEPLKGNLSGYHSKEIDKKNRLVYRLVNNAIVIFSCKGHYDDK